MHKLKNFLVVSLMIFAILSGNAASYNCNESEGRIVDMLNSLTLRIKAARNAKALENLSITPEMNQTLNKIYQNCKDYRLAGTKNPLDRGLINHFVSLDLNEQFASDNKESEGSLWNGDYPTADLILLFWNDKDKYDDQFRKHGYTISLRDENQELDEDDGIEMYKSWYNDVCFIGEDGGSIGTYLIISIDDENERKKLYNALEPKIFRMRTKSPEFYEERGPELTMTDDCIEIHFHEDKPWMDFNAVTLLNFNWNNFEDECLTCSMMSLDDTQEILDWYGFKETVKEKKHHMDGDVIWEYTFEAKDNHLLEGMVVTYYISENEGSQININFPNQTVKDNFLFNCLANGMNTDNNIMYWYLCCAESGIYMEVKDLKARIYSDGMGELHSVPW